MTGLNSTTCDERGGPVIVFIGMRTFRNTTRRSGAEQRRVRTLCITPNPKKKGHEAHHVLPLFLLGPDAFPNVVPWPNAVHGHEHGRLRNQPHLKGLTWLTPLGALVPITSTDLYRHPRVEGGLPYIIDGMK